MSRAEGELRATLAERTADVIRQRILSLAPDYRPGDRLYPSQLANDLNVSVTPIREALKLLAAERLVEFSPRRGVSVTRFSLAELGHLVAVLAGLETLAVRLGGGRHTNDELVAMSKRLDACERALARKDLKRFRDNDAEFHRLLVAGSRNPPLIELYEIMLKRALITVVQNPDYPDAMSEALAEHRELVRQLATGDGARLEAALEVHWEHSYARLRRRYGDFVRAGAPNGSHDGQIAEAGDLVR